jgi:PAS domain S-box-containing protein
MTTGKAKVQQLLCGRMRLMVLLHGLLLAVGAAGADERGIAVGAETAFLPYSGLDTEGRSTGFAVELLDAAARVMDIPTQFHHGPWNQVWQDLQSGALDALPLVARLPEREGLVEFTRPHTYGYDAFFVRADHTALEQVEEARELNVIVLRSDASHQELLRRGFGPKLVLVDDLADGFRLLASGQHDAVLAPLLQGNYLIRQIGLGAIIKPGPLLMEYRREFCFATRKGNIALRDRLDQGLAIVKASGEYDRLYRKWLEINEPVRFPIRYVIWGAGLGACLLAFMALWNGQLRRKVALRTDELARSAGALQLERQRLYDLLQALPVYVVLLTPDHQVPFANRFFENRYGRAQGRRCHDYLFERDKPCEICRTFDVLKTRAPVSWSWTGPDGRDYEIHDLPFTDSDGSPMILEVGIDVTEANRAKQALREANQLLEQRVAERTAALEQARQEAERINDLLRTTMDNAPALMSYVDQETRYRRVNQVYGQWFGLKPDEVVGRSMREVVGEGVWPLLSPHVARAQAGEPQDFEVEVDDPREGPRWMHATYSPDRDASGQVRGFVVHVLDITARKKAERSLRESEERFRAMADSAPVFIWIADTRRQRTWVNQQWLDFTGRRLEQEFGEGWTESIHPEDRPKVRDVFYEAFERDAPFEVDYRLRRADGVYRWIVDRGVPRHAQDGAFLGFIGACADVSDAKEADLALQRERAFLRQVIDASPSLIFVKDRSGRFLLANRALAEVYGTDSENVIGKTDADLHASAEQVARFRKDDLETMDKRSVTHIPQETAGGIDGNPRWFSTIKVPLLEEDGSCNKVLGVSTDITQHKQMEEALLEADRRKDEFLALLAHELRNPLAPISNAVQVLETPGLAPSQAKWCHEVIGRQVAHLKLLVDDLLDVSRISRGVIVLKEELLDLADVLHWAIETCRPLIEARRHSLSTQLPQGPVYLNGDRVRLTQVVSNLLNNAAKYTDPGGRIDLTVDAEPHRIRISIRDNGRGIDPSALGKLFDLFFQADRTLDSSEGGLGIGLWLAHSLARMHGGDIQAYSAGRGQGTEFVLSLPRAPAPPPDGGAATAPEAQPRKALDILIVDDNPDVACSTALLLDMHGYRTRTAHDGETALKLAREQCPQLAILDIGLPGMDGLSLARAFRQDPALRSVRLVALTGYGRDVDLSSGEVAGFDRYLTKPAPPDELLAVLEALASEKD